MYPKISLWLIHPEHGCLRFLQTIIFQVIQDKYRHGLHIFKYLVFVYARWTDTLFAGFVYTYGYQTAVGRNDGRSGGCSTQKQVYASQI
jgi:hypothetical protein